MTEANKDLGFRPYISSEKRAKFADLAHDTLAKGNAVFTSQVVFVGERLKILWLGADTQDQVVGTLADYYGLNGQYLSAAGCWDRELVFSRSLAIQIAQEWQLSPALTRKLVSPYSQ